jgi:hypothetical protein
VTAAPHASRNRRRIVSGGLTALFLFALAAMGVVDLLRR